jgi:hypothetical protein
MSRVEPKERPARREAQEGRRQAGDRVERNPRQAAGDKRPDATVRNEARRN